MPKTSQGINSEIKTHHGPEKGIGEPFQWQLTDHCCRVCFSRVLMRKQAGGKNVYRCAGCGAEKEGDSAATICACGMKLKTRVDAGVRCMVNMDRSPEFPAEIVATTVG